jgi:DNA-binding SARP family transcriptional activator
MRTRLACVALAGSALIALAMLRPNLPELRGELSRPLVAGDLKNLVELALWCLALGLAVTLTIRVITPRRRPAQQTRAPERRRAARAHVIDRLPSPTPLMLLRRPATPDAESHHPLLQNSADEPVNDESEPAIQIGLLGPFMLAAPSGRRIKRTATRSLIAYLALHPHGATRDELLEALWPGAEPRRTRQRLAQSITEARKLLGDALRSEHDRYTLNRDLVAIDLDALTATGDGRGPGGFDPMIVRGVPLGDIDAPWTDAHRPGLLALAQDALISVAGAQLARGDYGRALDAAQRGLALDELNEVLWQVLLRAHAGLGARTAVSDSYQRLTATLDRDLGVSPSRDTQFLYRELLADEPTPKRAGKTATPSQLLIDTGDVTHTSTDATNPMPTGVNPARSADSD